MVELSSVGDGNVTDIVVAGRAGLSLVRVFVPAIRTPGCRFAVHAPSCAAEPCRCVSIPSASGRLKAMALDALAGANAPRPTSSSRLT